jgi:hypothetical protein
LGVSFLLSRDWRASTGHYGHVGQRFGALVGMIFLARTMVDRSVDPLRASALGGVSAGCFHFIAWLKAMSDAFCVASAVASSYFNHGLSPLLVG